MEIYRNQHWVATPDGIEGTAKEHFYWIAMDRILEITYRDSITYYEWPVSIAEKECVEIRPFVEAFLAALRFLAQRTGAQIDEEMLARSLKYAFTYMATLGASGDLMPAGTRVAWM